MIYTAFSQDRVELEVKLENPVIAQAYYHEWEQIVAASEPLDWDSEYVKPQWRIGT